MKKYLLLLRQTPAHSIRPTPEELKEIIDRYSTWSQDLRARGLMVVAEKLTDDGGSHVIAGSEGPNVQKGLFDTESDVITGFFVVRAEDEASAAALAETCPHVRGSQWIEVRQIEDLG